MELLLYYIKWGFESRLKRRDKSNLRQPNYIKWGFESRLKLNKILVLEKEYYIKWGFERLNNF